MTFLKMSESCKKENNIGEKMIKILIVDDQSAIRTGLILQLETEKGLQVIGEAKNGTQAIRQAQLLQPDIIIMDLDMPVMNGLAATTGISSVCPDCKVIILSIRDDPQSRLEASQAGAVAFVAKSDVEKLLMVIREVASQGQDNT